jgi:hypothetical protein
LPGTGEPHPAAARMSDAGMTADDAGHTLAMLDAGTFDL